MLGTDEFVRIAKQAIRDMLKETTDPTDKVDYDSIEIYFVTCTFVLGSIKGMFSTSIQDGKYYEVTYNNDTHEMYVDMYVKVRQNKLVIRK